MYTVYILFSQKLDKHYIGLTGDNLEERIRKHNVREYGSHRFTAAASDWKLRYRINCKSLSQARNIELHIKPMKSKIYLQNLEKYPEMSEKLLKKYE